MSAPQPIEDIAGRYRVVELLGRGAFARGYLCDDLETEGRVVVKLYDLAQGSWDVLKMFEREAAVLETMSHPAIPRYVDHRQLADGRLMLVQSYVPGSSLAQRMKARERFTEERIVDLADQVLGILAYLQSLNPPIIHRDIKPGNLVIDESSRVHLIDFGSVKDKLFRSPETSSTIAGTYGYMAPEQFQGRASTKSDLYALGATLVHVLSHVAPSDLPQEGLKLDFRDSIHVSRAFADWLDRMLEPDPRMRFANAEEALLALRGRNDALVPRPLPAQSIRTDDAPPYGSRIRVTIEDREMRLVLPGSGLASSGLATTGFATFWLVFITFWTAMAERASFLFASFSIPFWIVGVGMMGKGLFMMFGRTEIRIGPDQFSVRKSLFGFSYAHTGETANLHGAAQGTRTVRVNRQTLEHCVLHEGAREITFGSALSSIERDWIVARINRHLGRENAT